MLENGFSMRPARPRARGLKRFITMSLPTQACATTRSSTSSSWLFSALAIADSSAFRTSVEILLLENSRSASAVDTFLPRMSWARRLSFCGLTRSMRTVALASLSARRRGLACLDMGLRPLRLLVGGMAVEGARRRELAELVADHLLRHEHGNVLVAVVDAEGQSDELRQDGRPAAPDLDDVRAARTARDVGLLQQIAVDERPFPDRARHGSAFLLPRVPRRDDELVGGLVGPGLLALGRLAPGGYRMAAARSAALAAAVRMIDRVHGDAAVVRTMPEPAVAARLAERGVHVVRVRHGADRGEALAMDEPLLAGVQAERDVALIAADDLRVGSGRAGDDAAPADLHLDVVDDRADRDAGERHGVAGLHVDLHAGDHLLADRQALRGDDIGLLAVGVL